MAEYQWEKKEKDMKLELQFDFEKATKNTIRYRETGASPSVGVLYVQRHCFGVDQPPRRLYVVVANAPMTVSGVTE